MSAVYTALRGSVTEEQKVRGTVGLCSQDALSYAGHRQGPGAGPGRPWMSPEEGFGQGPSGLLSLYGPL